MTWRCSRCPRPYVRTRPDPDTGLPARFCIWHPDAEPPLDAAAAPRGKQAKPTVPKYLLPDLPPAVAAKPGRNVSEAGRAAMRANAAAMRLRRTAKVQAHQEAAGEGAV